MDTDAAFDGLVLASDELHEIETTQAGETVDAHFSAHAPRILARYLDRLATMPSGSTLRTVLVVDLRPSGVSPDAALAELRAVLTRKGTAYAPDSRSMWAGVRFMYLQDGTTTVGDEVSLT